MSWLTFVLFLKNSETWSILWCKSSINNKKRIWFSSTLFIKIYKVLKVNVWRMIKCNLLKFSVVSNFHSKIVCNIFWKSKIRFCDKNKRIFRFLPIINNSVTVGLRFLLLSISAIMSSKTINIFRFLFGLYSSVFL